MSKFISLKSLPTILEPLKRLISHKAQDVDWNENDPASPGYIANRTHYKAIEKAYWWENQNVAFEQMDENVFVTSGPNPMAIAVESDEVIVVLDGFEYKCQFAYNEELDLIVVGNIGPIMGANDTGEPFCWAFYPGEFSQFLVFTPGWEHTISIYAEEEVVHKIPEEYLPQVGVGKKFEGDNGSGEIFNDYENNYANGHAHAEGSSTIASGLSSHTEGIFTHASGQAAHAEGLETIANGAYSHAEGFNTEAKGVCQHVQGLYNVIDNSDTYLHIVGNGTSSKRSNAYTLDKSGNAWFAGNIRVGTSGAKIAINIKDGENDSLRTLGTYVEDEKYKLGQYAFAQGEKTLAPGQGSFSSGNANIAAGEFSHTEGAGRHLTVPLSGESNVSEYSVSNLYIGRHYVTTDHCCLTDYGEIAKVISVESSKITFDKTLSKTQKLTNANVFFVTQYAQGNYSHAEGYSTKTEGYYSHAEGCNTAALSASQHVQGKYNLTDANNVYAHIVGNGGSSAARSNAHTLDWNGLGWFAGGLKIGGTGQDDKNAVSVLTENDLAIITESEIDAICGNTNVETWQFTMTDGSITEKQVVVSE